MRLQTLFLLLFLMVSGCVTSLAQPIQRNWFTTNINPQLNITNGNLISTNIYVSNVFATNITANYITNLNTFNGRTTITTNLYVTNAFISYLTNNTFISTNAYISNAYITNLFVDNIVTNNFTTNLTVNNLTVNTNAYITNLFATTTISTNNTFNFITNDILYSTNIYTTNLTANYITNNTLITTNAFISNAFITNITIFEAQWDTNKWVGPTNDIDFSFGTYQKFLASTDMEITGLKGVNPTNENTTVLLLDPGGANRTLYFPNNWTNYTLDKGNAYTIGSTNIAIVTLSQYGQENTNVLVRIWGVIPTATTAQVWSNYQGFIFPAGEPAPDTSQVLKGPSVFFRGDGSLFSGTNLTQDVDITDTTYHFPLAVVSMTDSNEPAKYNILGHFTDSENFTFYSQYDLVGDANKDAGFTDWQWKTGITNQGFREDIFRFVLDPSDGVFGTRLFLRTNGNDIFAVDKNGLVTANAFTDKSFAANGVVTNDSTGLLHTTPTLPSTLLPNDLAYTDKNNAFTTASSNYVAMTVTTSTNQNQVTPDFSIPEQLMSTNAAFKFLAPVGVDATKTTVQWTLVNVTNTTAAAVLITSPDNCHTVGTAYVTNLTAVWFQCYAQKFTNAFYIPVF